MSRSAYRPWKNKENCVPGRCSVAILDLTARLVPQRWADHEALRIPMPNLHARAVRIVERTFVTWMC